MSTASLSDYYQTNTILLMEYGISLNEMDQMIPFERDLYCHMISQRIEEKRKKQSSHF